MIDSFISNELKNFAAEIFVNKMIKMSGRISKIAIVGAGAMGCGIGYAAMRSGYGVVFIARGQKSIETGSKKLKQMLDGAARNGELSEAERQKYLDNLKFSLDLDSIKPCELIIEAIKENAMLKQQLLKKLSSLAAREAIISTSTSSIPVTELSTAVKSPERFIGMHFFNPVHKIRIVEIIRGEKTSAEIFETAEDFAKSLGKIPIAVKDRPGFASSRMIVVYINEAIRVLEEGVASKEEIDSMAKLAFGHPMGPIKLADFIGLDVLCDTLNSIFERTQETRYKPGELLVQMVKDGKLGMKTGRGFYEYRQGETA